MAKTIVVTGATGTQGSSIVRVMLETGEWKVRAVTRNPESDAAKAIAAKGAEIVVADYDDEKSVKKAFEGAQAIFALTNWWEYLRRGHKQEACGEIEERQGMTLARAAAEIPTLEHYIWSTLPAAKEITGGKHPVPHFDYKAVVDRRIRDELPALAAKTTSLFFGFYPSNFAYFPMLKPMPVPFAPGRYVWLVPSTKEAKVPISGDMTVAPGVFVRQILANPSKTHGKYAAVCAEVCTLDYLLKTWSEVTGKTGVFMEISVESFTALLGVAGQEAALQLKFGEAVPDWYEHVKDQFVSKEELGITVAEIADFRGSLEALKEHLG
ncbi:hypothetical protein IWX90DRAFT_96561 [Phyllosticta citrichinensis]|uniref:NmrA-like domain-containing protein n=1 Tax=Phyllosticta citrichinensis TaxID=1130410 RepID=A0ABR1XET3_9PEZI